MKKLLKKVGTQNLMFCAVALMIILSMSCSTARDTSQPSGAGAASQVERLGRAAMFTHNDCVGYAEVVLRGDTVVSLMFDDISGPRPVGNLTNVANRGDVETIAIGNATWARTIRVGNEVFRIPDGATQPTYAGSYRGTPIPDLQEWLGRTTTRQGGNYGDNVPPRTPEEWMWYVDAALNGQIVFLNASGQPASIRPSYFGSNAALSKNSSTYWGADGTPPAQVNTLGWKLNREAVEAYALRRSVRYPDPLGGRAVGDNTGTMTRRPDHVWQFSDTDVVTGATMVDTPNYLKVIQLAYENARRAR